MLAAAVVTVALPWLTQRFKRVKGAELAFIGANEQRHVAQLLLPAQTATIGRSKDADVSIDNKRLSSLHASVAMNADGSFTLKDLNSLNHVYYRHEPEVPPQQWKRIVSVTLSQGGRFMLGSPLDGGVLIEVTLTDLQA
jgi:pSer/pThr/pTyr-binding forkhead associated (FHA) protein